MLLQPEPSDFLTNYTSSDDFGAIKKKIDSDYLASLSTWQTYWKEATLDTRLEAGDARLMSELLYQLPNSNQQNSWYFNHVRPLCNMVSGYQRRNRKSTIVVPLENGDQKTADQWTKIILGIYKREGVYESISDAFHQGACITGMNLLHVFIDYQNDPISGDVKVENCSYNSFFIDPYFRKTDLSDCSFVWKRSYLSQSAAAALMPSKYDEIMSLTGKTSGMSRDNRFTFMPENYGQSLKNKVSYDEYYYRDYRKQKLLMDREVGVVRELTEHDDIDLPAFLSQYPQITVIEQYIPTVRMTILIQDKVFYDGPNPLSIDTYPFVPIIGYFNPMMPDFYTRIQGICRSLRDPQLLLNRRIVLSSDLLESQVNSGFIYKENAVIDPKHLFQTGQGRCIPIKADAQITDVQPINPPQIPPSFFQMQETFNKELNFVSGVNEELIGSAIDDKAGILSALRQGAGLITLQPIYDRLDKSQNLLGNIVMSVVRNNYTPGKIKLLLEGQEPEPLFYDKAFGKYHCMVEMGFDTESQKQMQFAQLVQLKEMGVPIPNPSLIESATIQNKTKINEQIQSETQQAQQMQEAQAQVQMQEIQARTNLAKARTIADEGLGMERYSRIEENKALAQERKSEAVKDDQQALLNFVKAIKELDDIDIRQLEKLLSIQNMLKSSQEGNPQPEQNGSIQEIR